MIEIIIPTLGRCDNQITLSNIPKSMLSCTTLVVQEHEYEYMNSKYGMTCNVWKLPVGTKGIALTRKLIAQNWRNKRYFVMDDDLSFVKLDKIDNKMKAHAASDEELLFAISQIENFMDDGIVHGCFTTSTTPPSFEEFDYNSRMWTNVFYSEHFPIDDIDFGEEFVLMPEDFYVNLQLLTKGYSNVVFNHLRVSPGATNSKGGCELYRTIENHNTGQQILADKFPDFVKITEKIQKSGPWKDIPKKSLSIQWKKAYNSSQTDESILNKFI